MISKLIQNALDIIEKVVPDPSRKEELKAEILKKAYEGEFKAIEGRNRLMASAFKSPDWIGRNWPALLMLCFGAIIPYDFLLCSILRSFGVPVVTTPIPHELWNLFNIVLGGGIGMYGAHGMWQNIKKR